MESKGALALLADYGGDSSDDEVPGTRISTKRMWKDDDNDNIHNKQSKRLPVPNFEIKNPETIIDDPIMHEGRIRSFAHERGNWASYVYIPFENSEGLQKLILNITNLLSEENVELKWFSDFHLSLTKTVILKHHWIKSFAESLTNNLAHFTTFIIMLDSLEVYANEEKTRTFIGLQIKTGYSYLLKLIECLDECLSEFKLPKFYENPSFHISIGWCLGDHSEKLKSLLPKLNQEFEQLMNEYSQENWYIYVQQILCKIGNKVFQFELR